MSGSILERKMIFVVGNSRSGTTMMGRVLGNIPTVYTFHELHFFEYLWDPTSKKSFGREELVQLAARLLSIERDGYLNQKDISIFLDEAASIVTNLCSKVEPPQVFAAFMRYEAELHDRVVPCDHTPRNVLFLEQIFALFPNAYVIHMLRDPRDVLLSQKGKWRRRSLTQNDNIPWWESMRAWTNYHPVTMSLLWNANLRAAEEFGGHPRLFWVRFEAFVQQPEVWLRKICSWLDMEYSPDYLLVPQVGSSHGKDNLQARGIKPEMAGRWQTALLQDRADLLVCEQVCRHNMNQLGYSAGQAKVNLLALIWIWLTWPIKTGLAFFFNLGRSQNIFVAINRRLKGL